MSSAQPVRLTPDVVSAFHDFVQWIRQRGSGAASAVSHVVVVKILTVFAGQSQDCSFFYGTLSDASEENTLYGSGSGASSEFAWFQGNWSGDPHFGDTLATNAKWSLQLSGETLVLTLPGEKKIPKSRYVVLSTAAGSLDQGILFGSSEAGEHVMAAYRRAQSTSI